jgi:hypothetical protein
LLCLPLIALKAQRNLRPRTASSNPERASVTHGLGVRPPAKSYPPAYRKHDAARSLRLFLAMLLRVPWSPLRSLQDYAAAAHSEEFDFLAMSATSLW